MEIYGLNKLKFYRSLWFISELIVCFLGAFTVFLLLYGPNRLFGYSKSLALYGSIITLFGMLWWTRPWKISLKNVSGIMNRSLPELEESCDLLLKADKDLNRLERFQKIKIGALLENSSIPMGNLFERLKPALLFFLSGITLCILFLYYTQNHPRVGISSSQVINLENNPKKGLIPTIIEEANVKITPPAYTKLPPSIQSGLNLKLVQGSRVQWDLTTPLDNKISILLNGILEIPLHNFPEKKSGSYSENFHKRGSMVLNRSGFYQIQVDGVLSEIYSIEVIPDLIPSVEIVNPKPDLQIIPGESLQVTIKALVKDDFGLVGFTLKGTIAKGSGEGVKFKEFRLPLFPINGLSKSVKACVLSKFLDLSHLGMAPGDQLYYSVLAKDNLGQIGESDILTLSIQDTLGLLSLEGLASGVDIKPEFFRSERQIIIDAENLIKTKNTLSLEDFNVRSGNLGLDQKILRLRYGKFLGEESESGVITEGSQLIESPADFGNGKKILDAYTDKHDQAEDATFFSPSEKSQLKSILNEMWKSELNLRLNKPQSALPFAYKALVLLKDLQQKSRAYVAKAPQGIYRYPSEKRLSGDLAPIVQNKTKIPGPIHPEALYRIEKTLQIIEKLRFNPALSLQDEKNLGLTDDALKVLAEQNASLHLKAYSQFHSWIFSPKRLEESQLEKTISLLQAYIPNEEHAQKKTQVSRIALYQDYLKNLEKTQP